MSLYDDQENLIRTAQTSVDFASPNFVGTAQAKSGSYLFEALHPGDYVAKFSLPESFAFTSNNQGIDDAIDSDVNPETGETVAILIKCT